MIADVSRWIIPFVALVFALLWRARRLRTASTRLPLPPSPPGYPIIGNLLDVPTRDMEPAYRDLCAKYGDIVYLNACGQPMIVLGTHKAAVDLLQKRSANYSDRLFSVVSSLGGWSWQLGASAYGAGWRRTRRLLHEHMHVNAVPRYRPIQQRETCKYLLRIIDSPEDFLRHGRHLFGATFIRVGYGIDVDKDKGTDYIEVAETAMAAFSQIFLPGKYLVESFPKLAFLPSFMPGGRFKRDAGESYPKASAMRDLPWEAAMVALREGRLLPSMASALLERIVHLDVEGDVAAEEEELSKNAVASGNTGGADTMLSTLQTFYIAMASFPEVQKRAQAELEAVVGPHRMPTFDDGKDLPYVSALIKECLRWRPVVPLALVHLSMDEDEYRGYRIPARSAVVANLWAYARDPEIYPDPEIFKPERFLKDGKLDRSIQDPAEIVFGYGRRICPGLYFAESSVYAAVTAILHTMTVETPRNERGEPIRLAETVKMTHGVISYPEPFECIIKPRSPDAEVMIRAACSEDVI